MTTVSEELFAEFCRTHGFDCERLQESSLPTPDFIVRFGDSAVICEIKQLESGQLERAALAQARDGVPAAYWDKNRLREKLKRVSRQLQRAASDGVPTLLVVFDDSHLGMQLGDLDVKEALYGQVGLPVGFNTDGEPVGGDLFFGGNRALSPNHNTSVSAVGVLERRNERLCLRIYHNLHATVPLNPDDLQHDCLEHKVRPGDTHIEVDYS